MCVCVWLQCTKNRQRNWNAMPQTNRTHCSLIKKSWSVAYQHMYVCIYRISISAYISYWYWRPIIYWPGCLVNCLVDCRMPQTHTRRVLICLPVCKQKSVYERIFDSPLAACLLPIFYWIWKAKRGSQWCDNFRIFSNQAAFTRANVNYKNIQLLKTAETNGIAGIETWKNNNQIEKSTTKENTKAKNCTHIQFIFAKKNQQIDR